MDSSLNPSCWQNLRQFTTARIALGRTGTSLTTRETLNFAISQAAARHAVHTPFNNAQIRVKLEELDFTALEVHSAAPTRAAYLQRPDLGRRLSSESCQDLSAYLHKGWDIIFIIGDGLSSSAAEKHALCILKEVRPTLEAAGLSIGPVVVANQARVALGDEVGELLDTTLVIMLIGERPGLATPDSLGIYVTWMPHIGTTATERNCITNIHPEGLTYSEATQKLVRLIHEARRLEVTGHELNSINDPLMGTSHRRLKSII